MNTVYVEKHLDGVQVYLNDDPYLWNPADLNHTVNQLAKDNKAEVEYIDAAYSNRHYFIDWNCTWSEFQCFIGELFKVSVSVRYFSTVGHVYVSVKAYDRPNATITTVEDVMHQWRKKIRVIKTLATQPRPQDRYYGEWCRIEKRSKVTQ